MPCMVLLLNEGWMEAKEMLGLPPNAHENTDDAHKGA